MRAVVALAVLIPGLGFAATRVSGDIVIAEDTTGQAHVPGVLGVALPLCAFGGKSLYGIRADDYDGIVLVSTHPMNTATYSFWTTPAGYVVRQADQGVSQGGFLGSRVPRRTAARRA